MAIKYVKNASGPLLGFSEDSGVKILEQDGLKFKDHSKTGELLPYEDWRLSAEDRTRDLLKRLSVPELTGLMFHRILRPGARVEADDMYSKGFCHAFAPMGSSNQSDLDKVCEEKNHTQEIMEQLNHAIPAIFTGEGINQCRDGGDGNPLFSKWPTPLGIASTFDPKYAAGWGRNNSREMRAIGLNVALEPQIDIASEPRWNRFYQTFGEGSDLTCDMSRAFIDAMQTASPDNEIADGWGYDSVCATAKHFPGGGTGESGRDAHFNYGKYAVYPGNNFEAHLKPFRDGAIKLDGPTGTVAYIMPYYTISYNQDTKNHENVGNGFSEYILQDVLRDKLGYTGGVFSDFIIVDRVTRGGLNTGRSWGVEEMSLDSRHLKSIMAGVNIFGADLDIESLNAAVTIHTERYGMQATRELLEGAVYHRLLYAFKQGLFENPYIDPAVSASLLPSPAALKEGYEAQQKSVILLKNSSHTLPIRELKKVYIPKRRRQKAGKTIDLRFAGESAADNAPVEYLPVSAETVGRYYELTDNPEDADFCLVFLDGPECGYGWSREDLDKGGNGYLPISLQYRPYTAETARDVSIAGGDLFENFTNRSYKGKTVCTSNESDLDSLLNARELMGSKPVIAVLNLSRPAVLSELEPSCDAIIVHSGIQTAAVLDIVSGLVEPSGLLPMQMPKNMETVEAQQEDVPFDMECYTDTDGNTYDYAYGLNWSGKISDWRTEKYGR